MSWRSLCCRSQLVQNKRNNHTYVLTQCGSSAPSDSDIALALVAAEIPADTVIRHFTIPLTNIVVEDTPPIAMMVRSSDRLMMIG